MRGDPPTRYGACAGSPQSFTRKKVTLTWWTVLSDRALPRSYRMMDGFGVHTFRLVNEAGPPLLK